MFNSLSDDPFIQKNFSQSPIRGKDESHGDGIEGELRARIEAQISLIDAALKPAAPWAVLGVCLQTQDDLLKHISIAFQQSSPNNFIHGHQDFGLYLREQRAYLIGLLELNALEESEVYSLGESSGDSDYLPSASPTETEVSRLSVQNKATSIHWVDRPDLQDEEAFKILRPLQNSISVIHVNNCQQLTDATFDMLATKSYQLKGIDLRGTKISNICLEKLVQKSGRLVALSLPRRPIDNEILMGFAVRVAGLKVLYIGWTGASEEVVGAFLQDPKELENISLIKTEANEGHINRLAQYCEKLSALFLPDIAVDESILRQLVGKNRQLRILGLSAPQVSTEFTDWIRTEYPHIEVRLYNELHPGKRQRTNQRTPLSPIRPSLPSRPTSSSNESSQMQLKNPPGSRLLFVEKFDFESNS